uniref:Uncharacterized protein n=1 Tax=Lotus japonicus TaxID=34305 RepID=I3SC38_LOTJA|nr:unknown [Lotus japonicus]
MGMATCLRLGRCATSNSLSFFRSQGSLVSAARCCSSSSSSSSSPPSLASSGKGKKKLVDRLSAVIDAVHDRNLPPELRGQRNNVSERRTVLFIADGGKPKSRHT